MEMLFLQEAQEMGTLQVPTEAPPEVEARQMATDNCLKKGTGIRPNIAQQTAS